MPDIFLIFACVLLAICALLYFVPHLKLLNFVDYGAPADIVRLNRYAAVRLLFPVLVNVVCSYVASRRPGLMMPLIFLTPLSILGVVIWISAGTNRLRAKG